MTLRAKLATFLSAVLLLGGLTGVALAANSPADDHLAEAEARSTDGRLAADDHAPDASDAADSAGEGGTQSEHNGTDGASSASDSLRDAADQVQTGNDQDESQVVRDRVAEMLRWIADQFELGEEFDGRTFGEGVANLARENAGAPELTDLPDAADSGDGVPEDVPSGPPEGVPARP